MTREPGRAPPRHAHGDLTSLAPHERLPEILVAGWAQVVHPVCLAPNQQQHLIELIRQRETEAALEFAQTQLAEQGEESRECLTEMERTLALLAFDNPEDSPFGDLLNMMQRQKVGSRGLPSTPSVDIQGRISKETG